MKRALLFLGIFAVIIFGMMSCLAPKVKNVTIDDFDWERTIDIEEIVTHNESDWQLPDGARLQYTKNEIKSYEQVIDHYEKVTMKSPMLTWETDILRRKPRVFLYTKMKPIQKPRINQCIDKNRCMLQNITTK